MSDLYEVHREGDKRTVVRTLKPGRYPHGNGVLIVKKTIKVPVVETFAKQYVTYGDLVWVETTTLYEKAVEYDEPVEPRPPSLWSRIVGWFWKESIPSARVVRR